MHTDIRAIAFDAFGTLVDIQSPQRPLLPLMNWLRANSAEHRSDEYEWLMTREFNLSALAPGLPEATASDIGHRLAKEAASIEPFPDARPVLATLKSRGYRLAICSNVITPYVEPTLDALNATFDTTVWSCAIGAAKPDPAIYAALIGSLSLPAHQILFVGDHIEHDVTAPKKVGMPALYLRRGYSSPAPNHEITILDELTRRLPPLQL